MVRDVVHTCTFVSTDEISNQLILVSSLLSLLEIQQLSCTDSDEIGSFQLSFRGQSVSVDATDTAADLETALNSLSVIEQVSISYDNPANVQVCESSEAIINIEFLVPTGNVPEISIDTISNIDGSLTITTITDGDKEHRTCSGRGLCNHDSGFCECFPGYASSDGQGNVGSRRDCGAINPYDYMG